MVLSWFELWSGLCINYHQSSIILLSRRNIVSEFVLAILGCNIVVLPIIYLGILIGKRKKRKREWFPLIDIIKKRLEGWKAKGLSMGERLVLLNAVPFNFGSMPLFLMSITKMGSWSERENTAQVPMEWSFTHT